MVVKKKISNGVDTSKIFILIAVLVTIGAAVLVINYIRPPSPVTPPIKLPVKEEVPLPEESEKPEKVKMAEVNEIKDEIITEAKSEIVKYQEESFYSEIDFSVILENEKEFKSQLIGRFKKEIIGVSAENCKVDLDEFKKSAMLKCDIKGARYGTNSYNMHFLLNGTERFGFDLYGFEEVGKRFIYEGKINGIPTKIVFEFPYEFGHCHEHVWPK